MYRRLLATALFAVLSVFATAATVAELETSTVATNATIFDNPSFGSTVLGGTSPLSYNGYLFVAYYNNAAKLCLARRNGSGAWKVITFNYTLESDDSHRTAEIGISPNDGRIHVAFDHHVDSLHYIVSSANGATVADSAFTSSLFAASRNYLKSGEPLVKVTYPYFLVGKNNDLVMTWRDDGGSGNANHYCATYSNGTWSSARQIISGQTGGTYTGDITVNSPTRNAYGSFISVGGNLHYAWTWRETAGAPTNHDIMYIYSTDNGVTWKNNAGTTLTLPVSLATTSAKIWSVPENDDLFNGFGFGADSDGNLHLLTRQDQATGSNTNRYWHYKRIGTTWTRTMLPTTFPVGASPTAAVDRTNNTVYLIANISSKVRIFAAEKGTNSWGTWTDEFTSTNDYMDIGGNYLSTAGNRLWIFAQRSGTGTTPTSSSAVDVIKLDTVAQP